MKCTIHGDNCPGDDNGFFIDGNHPDDMFGVWENKMTGKVVKAIADKRFGFIKGTDGKEYFFHQSDMNGFWDDLVVDIDSGRQIQVEFEVVPSNKGPRASGVTRTDSGV